MTQEDSEPRGPSFSLNDFKKWIEKQQEQDQEAPKNSLIGTAVESKVTFRKLISRMETDDGDLYEIAKEFKKNGGTISEIDGVNLLIETKAGSFFVHRMYVRRA